jgi:SAM-dependent methyltransferase
MSDVTKGIMLDLGCGGNKHGNEYTGIDKKAWPGVDIVHNLEEFPWPLEDESCLMILASHIMEHFSPAKIIGIFDECWRVLKEGAGMVVVTPYGGSFRFIMDPTHWTSFNEATFQYFDPRYPMYGVYSPFPWSIEEMVFSPVGDINCRLRKMKDQRELMTGGEVKPRQLYVSKDRDFK